MISQKDVPVYSPEKGIQTIWEVSFQIKHSIEQYLDNKGCWHWIYIADKMLPQYVRQPQQLKLA